MGVVQFQGQTGLDHRAATAVAALYDGFVEDIQDRSSSSRPIALIVGSDEVAGAQQDFLAQPYNGLFRKRLEQLGFSEQKINWISNNHRVIGRHRFFYPQNSLLSRCVLGRFRKGDVLYRFGKAVAVTASVTRAALNFLKVGQIAELTFYVTGRVVAARSLGVVEAVELSGGIGAITIGLGYNSRNPTLNDCCVDVKVASSLVSDLVNGQDWPEIKRMRFDPQLEQPVRPYKVMPYLIPGEPEDLAQAYRRKEYLAHPAAFVDSEVETAVCAATITRAYIGKKVDLLHLKERVKQHLYFKHGKGWIHYSDKRINTTLRAMERRDCLIEKYGSIRINGSHLHPSIRSLLFGNSSNAEAEPPIAALPQSFSAEQDAALKAITQWWKRSDTPYFLLFGYAGTGKTTVAIELANALNCKVAYCAFTGKAANVLAAKGAAGATTIHSGLYKHVRTERNELVRFVDMNGLLASADVIVLDECSMIGFELAADLECLGKRIIAIGDPFQLPPISGTGYFTRLKPDIVLEEIHRQAHDNPILRLAHEVRRGLPLPLGTYGDNIVVDANALPLDRVLASDQLLAGKRDTCIALNRAFRDLNGKCHDLPEGGDKLICRRNNRVRGLYNGQCWTVLNVGSASSSTIELLLRSEDGLRESNFLCDRERFTDPRARVSEDYKIDLFEFGHALTVHQCQGSEYDHAVVFDESGTHGFDSRKWLYTAVTRARKKLTVVKKSR